MAAKAGADEQQHTNPMITTGVYTMNMTRFLAALAVLTLLVGSVGVTTPTNAQTFSHSDNNGDNQ